MSGILRAVNQVKRWGIHLNVIKRDREKENQGKSNIVEIIILSLLSREM